MNLLSAFTATRSGRSFIALEVSSMAFSTGLKSFLLLVSKACSVASANATSLRSLGPERESTAAPRPRPPQPTSEMRRVSPGEAAWAKRSMGSALSSVPPATAVEVDLRKLRRETPGSVWGLRESFMAVDAVCNCVVSTDVIPFALFMANGLTAEGTGRRLDGRRDVWQSFCGALKQVLEAYSSAATPSRRETRK